MTGRRERKKTERNQRIQNAALMLFGRQGYSKTTISQIAGEADLGVGTVYNYYKSKEEILFSIIKDRSIEYTSELDKIISESNDDIIKSTISFIHVYFESFSIYNKTIWRELIGVSLSKSIPVTRFIDNIDTAYIGKLSKLLDNYQSKGSIKKDINITNMVSIIYELIISNILKYISDNDISRKDCETHIEKNIKILLQMIM